MARSSKQRERDRLLRSQLQARSNLCAYCGCTLTKETATLDHIIPRSRGGRTSLGNCKLSCGPCNSKKGDRVIVLEKLREVLGEQDDGSAALAGAPG